MYEGQLDHSGQTEIEQLHDLTRENRKLKAELKTKHLSPVFALLDAQGLDYVVGLEPPAEWAKQHRLTVWLDGAMWEKQQGGNQGSVWLMNGQPIEAELQAFEPQPDPSLARIANVLEEMLELQPGKQSKTRRELEQLRQVLERKQQVIDEVFSSLCVAGGETDAYNLLAAETQLSQVQNPDALQVKPLGSLLDSQS